MTAPRRMHGVPLERRAQKRELVRTPVTSMDRRAIAALTPGFVTYPVGSHMKRFMREAQTLEQLTDGQRRFLWRIAYSFRRQVRDGEVIDHAASVREWANERPSASSDASSDPTPVPVTEPTADDLASLPVLFDEMEASR